MAGFSATMTPFLYQTRTLAALHWTRSVSRPRFMNNAFGRKYTDTRRLPLGTERSVTCTPASETNASHDPKGATKNGNDGESKLTIRRTMNMHGPEAPVSTAWDPASSEEPDSGGLVRRTWKAPSDDMPWDEDERDMIRTGTFADRQRDVGFGEFEKADNLDLVDLMDPNSIDFPGEEEYEETDAIDQLSRRSRPQDERDSTITVAEKHAFQKIFSDIFARQQQARTQQVSDLDIFEEESNLPILFEVTKDAKDPKDKVLQDIMKKAAMQTMSEKEMVVSRYPPALRAAAARAIGLKTTLSPTIDENAPTIDDKLDQRLEELRKPERTRVETLMQRAKTDFQLWAIMEQEVFPLVSKLGLEDVHDKVEAPKKKPVKKKSGNYKEGREQGRNLVKPPKAEKASKFWASLPAEEGISPLAVVGPLYPSYLLLGLRLLDRAFVKPSPLTLAVLPKIKSLGLLSHVLGASTQLYNELLVIYLHRQDDFRGAESLLYEMEQAGLDWDAETLKTVKLIADLQKAVLKGDKGFYLRSLWNLPEFAPGNFWPWKEKIEAAIEEKARANNTNELVERGWNLSRGGA